MPKKKSKPGSDSSLLISTTVTSEKLNSNSVVECKPDDNSEVSVGVQHPGSINVSIKASTNEPFECEQSRNAGTSINIEIECPSDPITPTDSIPKVPECIRIEDTETVQSVSEGYPLKRSKRLVRRRSDTKPLSTLESHYLEQENNENNSEQTDNEPIDFKEHVETKNEPECIQILAQTVPFKEKVVEEELKEVISLIKNRVVTVNLPSQSYKAVIAEIEEDKNVALTDNLERLKGDCINEDEKQAVVMTTITIISEYLETITYIIINIKVNLVVVHLEMKVGI